MIGNLLAARHQARPLRMSAADYEAAPAGPSLVGTPTPATWDEALGVRMAARGCAVHEEQVLSGLLEELRR